MPAVPAVFLRSPNTPADGAAARLRAAVREAARTWDGRTVLRVSVPADTCDAFAWLAAQTLGPRAAWGDRDETPPRAGGSDTRAAVGSAVTVDSRTLADTEAVDVIAAILPAGARLYGTARFDPEARASDEWAPFGRVRFTLPRAEIVVGRAGAVLAANVAPGERVERALADLALLRPASTEGPRALPEAVRRTDRPGKTGWTSAVRWSLGAFAARTLDKVVLARRADVAFDAPVDPVDLLRRLAPAAPRCFYVFAEPAGQPTGSASAFVAATPERLFCIETLASGERRLATEAVAGTRPRAADDAADDALLGELMDSDKDRREHAFVREAIAARLAPLSTSVEVDAQAGAMTLARGRHIRTGIAATLAPATTAMDILRALHPTPAVGGTPREASRDAILRLEPFDRGLYAGAVGWIGRDERGEEASEFAVGIRSALVRGRAVSFYSGAGIVAGSDADAEWAEIESKLADFARVLGTTPREPRAVTA